MSFTNGDISRIPISKEIFKEEIATLAKENISISKLDWDAHETSWDFEANPLVALCNKFINEGRAAKSYRIENFVKEFEVQWEGLFNKLHGNVESPVHRDIRFAR